MLLQPDRGARGDRKQGYHDTTCPPRHAYVALYACAAATHERIDALVHLGTHGTLEWLPGKALALSERCFPEAVLGPVPVIYPFIVNNPGEAVQAKRRISAVTIGHLTPPLSAAGLHGPLAELEGLHRGVCRGRRRRPAARAAARSRDPRARLALGPGRATAALARDDAPRAAIAKLDAQLCDIKELAIRDRLHVFGRAPDAAARDAIWRRRRCAASAGRWRRHASRSVRRADRSVRRQRARVPARRARRAARGARARRARRRAAALDVLPTGRNLTTIDPRAIPTRTAAAIGARAAAEVVRRHLQDHGEYPRAHRARPVGVGLAAHGRRRSRAGARLSRRAAGLGYRARNRVTGVEVLPLAQLERPRIDVTLRISGLFRDIFQAQIALFDMAVARVAALDEDDEWNPLAAARRARRRASRASSAAAPGIYGAGAAETALDTALGDRGRPRRSLSRRGVARLRARRRRHRGDGAHSPSASRQPMRWCIRRTTASAIFSTATALPISPAASPPPPRMAGTHARALSPRHEPARGAGRAHDPRGDRAHRARAAHQSALDRRHAGHGHRGVAEMAQAVDALYAFAATGTGVPGHLFDAVHDALIADEAVSRRSSQANPAAAEAMAARLEDAIARGLWTPRRNAVHGELARVRAAAASHRVRA